MSAKPGPDELHIEDDEGRADLRDRLGDVVMAAQGFGNLPGALDNVWRFVFNEAYPWPYEYGGPESEQRGTK